MKITTAYTNVFTAFSSSVFSDKGGHDELVRLDIGLIISVSYLVKLLC